MGPQYVNVCEVNHSSGSTYVIKRTLYPAKPKVREAAYTMLVRPKLEYGSIAWSPHTQNNIADTLQKYIEVPPDS